MGSVSLVRPWRLEWASLASRSSPLYWLWRLSRDSGAVLGGLLVLLVTLAALVGPWLTGYDPLRADPFNRLLPPSTAHWLGTDGLGRDILTRILYGARVSLVVGLGTMILTSLLGGVAGLMSGYFRELDGILMRIMDGLMAFPSILLAVAIMAVRGPGVENVIIAITITTMPRLARLVRGQVLVTREQTFIEAAAAVGARPLRILFRHILPNSLSPLIVQASFTFAVAVVTEAALSFLGAGVPPQQPAWGNMLQESMAVMTVAPWVSIFPGLAIAVTVLGLNLLGDGLRDSLDPRTGEA